jgi:hypothetical protein
MSELQFVFGNPRKKTAKKAPTYRRNPAYGSDENEDAMPFKTRTPLKLVGNDPFQGTGYRGVTRYPSDDGEARERRLEELAKEKAAQERKLRSAQAQQFLNRSTAKAKKSGGISKYGTRAQQALRGEGEFADPLRKSTGKLSWYSDLGDEWSSTQKKAYAGRKPAATTTKREAIAMGPSGWADAAAKARTPIPMGPSGWAREKAAKEKGILRFETDAEDMTTALGGSHKNKSEFNKYAKSLGGQWSIKHKGFVLPGHPDFNAVVGSAAAKETTPRPAPRSQGGTLTDLVEDNMAKRKSGRKAARKGTRKATRKATTKASTKAKKPRKATTKAEKPAAASAPAAPKKRGRKAAAASAPVVHKKRKPGKAARKAARKSFRSPPFTKVRGAGKAKNAVVVAKGGLVKVGKNVYRANPWGGMLSPNANIVEKTLGMSMVDIGALLAAGGSYSAINGVLSRLPILNKVKATLDNTPGVKIISSSILPMLAGILLKKYLGNKNRMADAFGSALIITSISGVGVSALSPLINKTAGGLSGVDYTPYGALPEGLEGVDYTPYGGVPEGLEGVPEGLEGYSQAQMG